VIYEVSSHGALVTGASMEKFTKQLVYTLDSGESFHQCDFRSTEIVVNNILTRSFDARNFLLEGRTQLDEMSNGTWTPGIVVHFDFEDSGLADCTDADCNDALDCGFVLARLSFFFGACRRRF
jgi:hypothetical protein